MKVKLHVLGTNSEKDITKVATAPMILQPIIHNLQIYFRLPCGKLDILIFN